MQFHTKGWIPTWAWEYEFNQLPEEQRRYIEIQQVIDTLRFPFINDKSTIGVVYFSALESGISYFDGWELDYVYCAMKQEIEAYEQNKTVEFHENYVEDCRIPKQF